MIKINGIKQLNMLDTESIRNVDVLYLSGIDVIPEGKFANLDKLEKVIIEGTSKIEAASFMNCPNLKELKISKEINVIEDFAFHGCNDNIIVKSDNEFKNVKFGVYNGIVKDYYKLPEIGISLNNLSWNKINMISEKGLAKNYFNIGDEKELQIGFETYHVQILGFNHDNLSNGTGKAGITVCLKEVMTTDHVMNSSYKNIGGWRDSKMRTYLQNDILSSLPNNLQSVIKTVDKISDAGNMNKTTLKTTEDKLFLLSPEEVGFNLTSYYVQGQGTKYEIFSDNASRIKKYLSGSAAYWWLRSAHTRNDYFFFRVNSSGSYYYHYASSNYSVAPAFCI